MTVEDVIVPVATCENITVLLDATGNVSITEDQVDNGSSDECSSILILDLDVTTFDCTTLGANLVELTVTDESGNSSTCSSIVTVEDVTVPLASCQNITASLDNNGYLSLAFDAIDSNSIDECSIATYGVSPQNFSCTDIGSQTVTLTVTDLGGNTSSCTANVTVEDSTPPVATCQDATLSLDATGNLTLNENDLLVQTASMGFTDSGQDLGTGIVADYASFDIDGDGDTDFITSGSNRLVYENDGSGNFTLHQDLGGNSISDGIDYSDVDGDGDNDIIIGYSDTYICELWLNDGTGTFTLSASFNNGWGSSSVLFLDADNDGDEDVALERRIFHNDGTGNFTFVQHINDFYFALEMISYDFNSDGFLDFFATSFSPTVADIIMLNNGDGTFSGGQTFSTKQSSAAELGDLDGDSDMDLIISTYQGNEIWLNNGAGVFTLFNNAFGTTDDMNDVTAFDADNDGDLDVYFINSINDNEILLNDGSANFTLGSNAPLDGYSYADSHDVNGDGMEDLIIDGSFIYFNDPVLPPFDNCTASNNLSYTFNPTSLDCSYIGSASSVTLTVTDQHNNTMSCVSVVNVQDVTSPTTTCSNISVSLDATGNVTIAEDQVDNGSIDECTTSLIFDTDITIFDCTHIGANLVELTVTDDSGNSYSCSATVEVNDVTNPITNCQDLTISLDATGNAIIAEDQVDNGTSDECSSMLIFDTDVTTFDCTSLGANLVILTVTDDSGNSSTCSSSITVEDLVAPTAKCMDITIIVNPDGATNTIAEDAVNDGSSDNCSMLIFDTDVTDFNISNLGANAVVLSVSDLSGNQSQCSAIVTVECSCDPNTSSLIANSEAGIHIATCKYDDGLYTHYCDNQGRLLLSIDSQTSSNINAADVSISITPGGQFYNQYCSGSGGSEDGSCFISNNDGAVVLCRTWNVNSSNTNASIRFYFDQNDIDIINDEIIANGLNPLTEVKQMWFYKVLNNSGHHKPEDLSTTDVQIIHNNNSGIASTDNWDLGMTAQSYYAQYEVSTFSGGGGGGAEKGSSPICPYVEADIVGTEILSAPAMADVNVNITGGLAPYTVILTNGTTIHNYLSGDPITVNVTTSTNYEIQTIIDSNGCPHSVLNGVATKYLDSGNTIPPTAICQNATIDLNASGFVSITASDIDNGSSDDQSIQVFNIDQNLFDCSSGGNAMVTLTVTDGDGNSDQCTSMVTINDPNGICCPYNLNLNNVVNGSKVYKADFIITSDATINNLNSNTDIKYHAGNNIELNSGFEVKQGSKFEADINPCNWP